MDSLTELLRRILHIERRVDRLESLETPTVGGGGVGAPNDAQYVTLALDAGLTAERVLTEGPDIDLVDTGANGTITVGRGGDTILLFDSGGSPVAEFAVTQAGLIAALAAAGAGDKVEIPQNMGALTAGITIPASVTVENGSLAFSAFAGTAITLLAGSVIRNVSVTYDGAGNANATGIAATAVDAWVIDSCSVLVHDATSSNYGIVVSAATAVTRGFVINSHGHSRGADARGIICGDHVTILNGCTAWGEGVDATSCSIHLTAAVANPAIIEWTRGADGPRGLVAAAGSGATIRHSSFTGSTTGLIIGAGATLTLEDVAWNSITNAGTILWQLGSRGNYSVEDYHGSDIEAGALTRHHTQPTGNAADAGKVDVLNGAGTAWILGAASDISGASVIDYSEQDVSNPPTEDDVISAFGEVAVTGPEFVGILNDAALDSHVYACFPTITGWWVVPLTKTALLAAAMLSILAADTFTDANGTHLNVHAMDTGGGWTEDSGSWTIQSNTAQQATAANVDYIATTDVGASDFKVRVQVKTQAASGAHQAGVVFRLSDTSNYWEAVFNTSTNKVLLGYVSGGGWNLVQQKAWTSQFQKYISIDVTCDGNDVTVTFDGGYTLSGTNAFNNTATKAGIVEFREGITPYKANTFEDFQAVDLPVYAWTRQGTVLSATLPAESSTVLEPTVIYDSSPQILTGEKAFKMWYTYGWGATLYIGYAESADGITWTKYTGNPIVTGLARSSLVKVGHTFYLYGSVSDTQIDLYTSVDGVNFSLDTASVLVPGGGGAWDDTRVANVYAWRESLTAWYMLYEACAVDGIYKLGLATSTDGKSWAKSGSNPVLTVDGGYIGGPYIRKQDGYYYLWAHRSAAAGLPSWLVRYRSANLTSWTAWPMPLEMARIGAGEGEDTYVGQVADPSILEYNGQAYLYFSATADGGNSAGNLHIVLATADARAIRGY